MLIGLIQQTYRNLSGQESSSNQFHYRWREHNKAQEAQTGCSPFESVSVIPSDSRPLVVSKMNVKIHLPNQIRCDIAVDLKEFASLLRQLVQPC